MKGPVRQKQGWKIVFVVVAAAFVRRDSPRSSGKLILLRAQRWTVPHKEGTASNQQTEWFNQHTRGPTSETKVFRHSGVLVQFQHSLYPSPVLEARWSVPSTDTRVCRSSCPDTDTRVSGSSFNTLVCRSTLLNARSGSVQ